MIFEEVIKHPVILKDFVPSRNWLIDVSEIHWNLNLYVNILFIIALNVTPYNQQLIFVSILKWH
jgi:hypothetical protein